VVVGDGFVAFVVIIFIIVVLFIVIINPIIIVTNHINNRFSQWDILNIAQ